MPIPINTLRAVCSTMRKRDCDQCPASAACRQHVVKVCTVMLESVYKDFSFFTRGNQKTMREQSAIEMMLGIHVESRNQSAVRDRRRRRRA